MNAMHAPTATIPALRTEQITSVFVLLYQQSKYFCTSQHYLKILKDADADAHPTATPAAIDHPQNSSLCFDPNLA